MRQSNDGASVDVFLEDNSLDIRLVEEQMKIWEEKGGHPLGGPGAEKMTLGTYEKTPENAKLWDFVDGFNPKRDNAFIHGPVGSGKSHAGTAIASAHGGRVEKLYSISRLARWGMKERGLSEGEIIGLYCGKRISTTDYFADVCNPLVIDDLGADKLTEFTEQVLFEILDTRIGMDMGGLVITSNLTLPQMTKLYGSERIPSRIAGLCKIFTLAGIDDQRIARRS